MEGLKKSFLVRGNNIVGFSDKNFSTAPIGTVLSFAGQTVPNGYLLADGASYKVADYPDLYAVIGNTYGGDTENFNVPNLVDKFIQGSTTSGTEKKAGLPNITGGWMPSVPVGYQNYATGAVVAEVKSSGLVSLAGSQAAIGAGFKIDASKSSAVYGNSDTVQPPALTMVYIIKAFHTNEGVDSGVSDDVINYINNSNSYSTEETLTGGKWIDGKPIYRKVLTAEVLASDNVPNTRLLVEFNTNTTDISEFILIKGSIKVKGTNKFVDCSGTYYVGDEPQLSAIMTFNGSNVLCVLKNGTVGVEWVVNQDIELKAIVEYTKTTD